MKSGSNFAARCPPPVVFPSVVFIALTCASFRVAFSALPVDDSFAHLVLHLDSFFALAAREAVVLGS